MEKDLGLRLKEALLNGDKGFDTKVACKVCFNHGVKPNIKENKPNRQKPKHGRKRMFCQEAYRNRLGVFAWVDKFRALLVRYERLNARFLGLHFIAFAMINLRHLFAEKV